MRLAVFTSKYPARVATFFERDMRALLEAGVTLDIFVIYPLDAGMWRYALELLSPDKLPRHRIHHLGLGESLRRARPTLASRSVICARDTVAVLPAAARYGPVPLAKTAYVLPKAWAWAAEFGDAYDHVLAYWGNYAGTCAYAFHRAVGRPIPFSLWLHAGTDLYHTPIFLREKLRYADNIITCCEFNRGYIWRAYPDAIHDIAPKLLVSHHGLDLGDFPFRPEGRPADRVIAVGRLAQHKGYDYLLRAAHVLYARGVDCTIELVGDGPERGALARLAAELGIAERVRFRGWLPFTEARTAMAEATVLVHPSDGLGDGLPNVVREAMALGTPVIASDVAGLPDALGDGCGVLVPPRDVAALATAIDGLLRDSARRAEIATRARHRTEEHYDMWRNGARLAGLLRATRRGAHAAPVSATVGPAAVQESEAC